MAKLICIKLWAMIAAFLSSVSLGTGNAVFANTSKSELRLSKQTTIGDLFFINSGPNESAQFLFAGHRSHSSHRSHTSHSSHSSHRSHYSSTSYSTPSTPASPPVPTTNLRIILNNNYSNEAVKKVQEGLKSLGYKIESTDGKYDSDTKMNIILFQKENGLKEDGIPDQDLLDYIEFKASKK